jgi:2,3-dihydroxybenzoate-AMP ligase
MTADYVAYHAADRPDAVAVIHDGRTISFAQFREDIRRAMRAVRELGPSRGGSIAVGADNLYLHWLLLLACEQLGIAAASFLSGDALNCIPLLASVDLAVAEPECPIPAAKRRHALTRPWIQGVLARANEGEEPALPKTPDDPVRIVQTSGTTGANKRFLITRRMHDSLNVQWRWVFGLDHRCRYLQTLPLVVRATYDLGSACLRSGGTLVLESRMGTIEALTAHSITHAILLPVQLGGTMDHLAPDFAKPRELTIVSFGAAVSPTLREKVTARLATSLCDLYGTVEVAAVSTIWRPDTDGFGTLLPQVQAEAVDDRDEPVPLGEMGRIRLKAAGMSEGYIDDPETTARLFRDGWFYPGDVGVIRPGRQLKIFGRADDLLNIGGQKFLPAVLEAWLLGQETAGDVGVCSLPNADGIEELCIAVAHVGHDDEELMSRIQHALRHVQVGRFHVVRLDRIPRFENGKLRRKLLREEVARAVVSR